jgi:hypothetical protein
MRVVLCFTMCTLSWIARPDHAYAVFFNRDEKKTRGRAAWPTMAVERGVRYLAPIDANAGGTWLTVNEYGVCAALLNTWASQPAEHTEQKRSRGLWPRRLAGFTSAADAMASFDSAADEMRESAAFTIAVFDAQNGSGPLVRKWDGQQLTAPPSAPLLSSSSFDPERVVNKRLESFHEQGGNTVAERWRWHSECSQPTAYTPRMLRADAQTWSISHIEVDADTVHWRYRDEEPDLRSAPVEVTASLPRYRQA